MKLVYSTIASLALAAPAIVAFAIAAPAHAQLGDRNQVGVRMGHVHLLVRDVDAHNRFWTETMGGTLGANPSRRPCVACISRPRMHGTADLPAMNLTLTSSETQRMPTQGRAIDHIGFDVENLDAFVRSLEMRGIALDGPVRQVPGTTLKTAFLTDPWGTRIELTEGLAPR